MLFLLAACETPSPTESAPSGTYELASDQDAQVAFTAAYAMPAFPWYFAMTTRYAAGECPATRVDGATTTLVGDCAAAGTEYVGSLSLEDLGEGVYELRTDGWEVDGEGTRYGMVGTARIETTDATDTISMDAFAVYFEAAGDFPGAPVDATYEGYASSVKQDDEAGIYVAETEGRITIGDEGDLQVDGSFAPAEECDSVEGDLELGGATTVAMRIACRAVTWTGDDGASGSFELP